MSGKGNLSPAWEKGQSGNPNGRPKGTGKPVSRLRSTLKKLQEMEEKALENIKNSVDGKIVDKETLATSKWVITTAVAINRAATADEALRHEIKKDNEEKTFENKPEDVPKRPKFSLNLVKDDE